MPVSNEQVVELFENLATLLEIKGDTVFKIRAYQRAANAIGQLPFSLEQAVQDEVDLKKVPGIGKAISDKIYELVNTGKVSTYERTKAEVWFATEAAAEAAGFAKPESQQKTESAADTNPSELAEAEDSPTAGAEN